MLKKRYSLFYFIMPLIIGFLQVACFDYFYGWSGIFLYSLLFFIIDKKPLTGFLQGYLYGVIYFTIHSWGFTTFIDVNNFPVYYKLLPILFYLVCALYSALWVMGLSFAKKYAEGWIRYILYLHITCFYIWWLHCKTLTMFFLDMGYPLLFSFTPIINNSALTYLFYKTGLGGGVYSIILINGLLAYILEKRGWIYYGVSIGLIIGLIIGTSIFTRHELPSNNLRAPIIHVRPSNKNYDLYDMIQQMCINVNKELEKYTTKEPILFVFPESALPFSFSERSLKILTHNILHEKQIQILIGTYYEKNGNLYNSAFLLQRSRIILHYDKKTLLPFWEFIPKHENLLLNNLFGIFLKGIRSFSAGSESVRNWFNFDNNLYLTILCSELFFTSFNAYPSDISLMCLLNDTHFEGSLLQRIMFLYGRFIAGTQRRKVFYMAHLHGWILGENGTVIKEI